jgi:hypothetical protein
MLWLLAPVVNIDASPDRSHHLARQTPQLIIEHSRPQRVDLRRNLVEVGYDGQVRLGPLAGLNLLQGCLVVHIS